VDLPSTFELVGRLVLAALLGGLIGLERELRDHPAGLRTHITVAVGSALFVIAGAYGWGDFLTDRNSTNITIGVDRVASNIVTGIGFLGGGAILKYGANIKGLTTAASLWVTSAVGLASGLGSYVLVVAATVITLISLVALRLPERWIRRNVAVDRETLVVRLAGGADVPAVISQIVSLEGVHLKHLTVGDDEGVTVIEAGVVADVGSALAERAGALASRPDVASVDFA
jgi:putative Mg2+ transporter-C (MgtC) family protein